ncbi:MAG: DUF1554 domain-containing protein [Bdellovibrionota bacterium]
MKKFIPAALVLITLTIIGCISHPSGGLSSSNILLYSTTSITEDGANDGTFNATIEVTLSGGEFVSDLGDLDFDTVDRPTGMSVSLSRVSDTEALINIGGQVTSEESCGNGLMTFYFKNSAFGDNKLPLSFQVPITIVYIRPALTYSTDLLTEDVSNDGSISQTFTVTTSGGGTFSQNSGVLDEGKYDWFDLPSGLTPVITVNSATQATVSFTDSAAANTPIDDVKAYLQFKTTALSNNFCEILPKKGFDIEFYRSVLMYALPVTDGNLVGRAGADAACLAAIPELPEDYNGARAFLSTSTLDVIDLPNQPSSTFDDTVDVESEDGTLIATNWADLFDMDDLNNSLADANVIDAATLAWTGSLGDGTADTNTCVDWTNGANTNDGQVGSSDAVDEDWLINGSATENCDEEHHVLCIAYVRN